MSSSTTYTSDPQKPPFCGYEWKTQTKLFGWPLIHVAWGKNSQRQKLIARGVIAVGQYACGGVVISQFGCGLICISQFGLGLFTVAQFTISLASISQFSLGIFCWSQFGICYQGIGHSLIQLQSLLL